MKLLLSFRALAFAALCLALCIAPPAMAAETRNAHTVLNTMRLKKWTKDLELSAEQQKKVQAILDDEAKEVVKLNDNQALDINERRAKIEELHQVTYGKMKPLLNETQLAKFEKSIKPREPKEKKS